ncbi:MAG: M56 family metallopeptidase, partial [Bacteroidota bacterium]
MFLLLAKSSLILLLCWGFYKLVLERESFFAANRWYLLGSLLLAALLPFVHLPALVEYQGVVEEMITVEKEPASQNALSVLVEAPIERSPKEQILTQTPISTPSPLVEPMPAQKSMESHDLPFWLAVFYGLGVLVFLLNLLVQTVKMLLTIVWTKDRIDDGVATILNLEGALSPCSFFHYIFINPTLYDYDTYEQILAHERIHVRQRHSFDLVLAELGIALLWFHPIAWLMRKEIEKNLEYQTDDLLVRDTANDKKSYQLNLVRIASGTKSLSLSNHYNQSLIKQRILKMNAKPSNPRLYWKYVLIAPMMLLLAIVLNRPYVSLAATETSSLLAPSDVEQFVLAPASQNASPVIAPALLSAAERTPSPLPTPQPDPTPEPKA